MKTFQLIPLQVNFPDLIQADQLTTGIAITVIGIFIALTIITALMRTIVSILGWSLSGTMMILVFLSFIPIQIYLITTALSFLGMAASGIFIARVT